jgi:hypothetical protein
LLCVFGLELFSSFYRDRNLNDATAILIMTFFILSLIIMTIFITVNEGDIIYNDITYN